MKGPTGEAGLFLELALGGAEQIFALIRLTLGNGPDTLILFFQNGPPDGRGGPGVRRP